MKRGMKKLVAGILMATLLMGSTLAVNAEEVAESGSTGEGKVEGTVKTDIFSVTVPLAEDVEGDFDFILDPEGLIALTSNAAYADSEFGDGNVFFNNGVNEESSLTEYSNTSNEQTIKSYSTIKVDVTVTATVEDLAGVTITDDNTFADDTSASLYLALKSADAEEAIEETTATLTTTLEAIDKDAYTYGWTEDDGYTYTLRDSSELEEDSIVAPAYNFALTGACNEAGDWSELAEAKPSVSLVWKVVPHVEAPAAVAPSIATTEYTITAGTAVEVEVDLGSGELAATDIAKITFTNVKGVEVELVEDENYTYADGVLTFTAAYVDATLTSFTNQSLTSRTFKVTFDDAEPTVIDVTLKTE